MMSNREVVEFVRQKISEQMKPAQVMRAYILCVCVYVCVCMCVCVWTCYYIDHAHVCTHFTFSDL